MVYEQAIPHETLNALYLKPRVVDFNTETKKTQKLYTNEQGKF